MKLVKAGIKPAVPGLEWNNKGEDNYPRMRLQGFDNFEKDLTGCKPAIQTKKHSTIVCVKSNNYPLGFFGYFDCLNDRQFHVNYQKRVPTAKAWVS